MYKSIHYVGLILFSTKLLIFFSKILELYALKTVPSQALYNAGQFTLLYFPKIRFRAR